MLAWLLLSILLYPALGLAEIIPAARRITWQGNVGVPGDIPTGRTNCVTAECNTLWGGTVTTASINSAITSASDGTVVRIPAGTYSITGSISPKSNITLRGQGLGATILRGTAGFSGDGLIGTGSIGNYYLTNATSFSLVNPTKGDTTITTTTNHNWSVGHYLQIDQLQDTGGDPKIQLAGSSGSQASQSCRDPAAACRPTGQTVKVTATPTGTTATIDPPLYRTYNQTPQAVRITDMHTGFGLEDMTVDNSLAANQKIIHFSGKAESWMYRVELVSVMTYGLFIYSGYKNTIRGCMFHEGFAGTGGGYTIMLWNRLSASLFEDNIIYNLGIVVLMDGAISGNVFAYNYNTLPTYGNNFAGTTFGSHGAHPIQNLFEGNQMEGRFRFDYTWGTSSHGTMFRNRIINNTNAAYNSARNLVDLWAWNTYYNVVGNYLGGATPPGNETIYAETSGAFNQSALVVYAFGAQTVSGTRGADSNAALNSVYRHGNWDAIGGQRWEEDQVNPDHTLPDSLYLAAKPSWYGTCTWPPVNPATPSVADIPAKYRYLGQQCPAEQDPPPGPPVVTGARQMQGGSMRGGKIN